MWIPTKYSKICSDHFISKRPIYHPDNPDYVPSIFPSVYRKKLVSKSASQRFSRTQNRREEFLSQEPEVIVNKTQRKNIISIYKKLRTDYPEILKEDIISQLVEHTGIGMKTISKLLLQYEKTGKVLLPKTNEMHKVAIRRKIHEFYFSYELPITEIVLQSINDDNNLPNFKRTSFYHLIKELNFEFFEVKRYNILKERSDIILWRRQYLRDIKRYRQEGRTIYYLAETYVNAADIKNNSDKTMKSRTNAFLRNTPTGPSNPEGKETRVIVLHIGSAAGFVPNGLLFLESSNNNNHHDDINKETFLQWFDKILHSLDDNSVIVIDNKPPYSVKTEEIPDTSWKKADIVKWLQEKGEIVDINMIKIELLQIVEKFRETLDKYVVNVLAQKVNKIILRLPPYHKELNAIDMVWSVVKQHLKEKRLNTTFEVHEVMRLLQEVIDKITPDNWAEFVQHVIEEEKKLWKIDYLMDNMLDNALLLIKSTNETESDSYDSD